jgi:hypothetical protein
MLSASAAATYAGTVPAKAGAQPVRFDDSLLHFAP